MEGKKCSRYIAAKELAEVVWWRMLACKERLEPRSRCGESDGGAQHCRPGNRRTKTLSATRAQMIMLSTFISK